MSFKWSVMLVCQKNSMRRTKRQMEVFRVNQLCRSFCGKTPTVNRRNCWCAVWGQLWLWPYITHKPTRSSQEQHMWTWTGLIWREAKLKKYWYIGPCIPMGWYFGLWKFAFPRTVYSYWYKIVPCTWRMLLLANKKVVHIKLKSIGFVFCIMCYKTRARKYKKILRWFQIFLQFCVTL